MRPPWLSRAQRTAVLATVFLYPAGYATVGLVLVLATLIAEAAIARRLPWQITALDPLICAFIGVFLVSGYLSEFRAMAVVSTGLAALTIGLAFTSHRIATSTGISLRGLAWAWAAGGALAAVWALARHAQSGLPATTAALGQNAVGTTMVGVLFLGLGLALDARGWRRLAAGVVSVLGATALVFSYTRGAWIGAAAALPVLAARGGRRARIGVLALTLVTLLGGAMLAGQERGALVARIRSIASPAANENRIFLLRSGLAIFRDHPVMGTGMNTFPYVYGRYRLPDDVNPPDARPNAHNIVVNMAAEGGVLWLAAFLGLLAQTYRLGLSWSGAPGDRGLRAAIFAALTGMLVHQLFDGTLLSVHLGFGMWLLMALLTSGKPSHA
jgi:O-antigen ligase